MASSGTIKSWVLNTGSISGNSCKGAYYSFEWSSQSAGAGVTLVSWNLYGRGRTSSPTKLENGIHLDVVANGTTTRLYTLDDSDGTAQTSFKNYLRTSGSFYVYHGSDGSGSFTINMNVKIYTGTWHYTSETAYLDANYLPTYTVSYNANGGSGAPGAQTKTYGTNLTLTTSTPSSPAATTSTGTITVSYNANGGSSTPSAGTGTYTNTTTYPFSHWNTASNNTGTTYYSGGTYSANSSATLYAQWGSSTSRTSNPTIKTSAAISRTATSSTGYKVTFNVPAGASSVSPITSTILNTYGFAGWNTNSSGTGTAYSANTNYTFSSNVTLYAKWTTTSTPQAITLPAGPSRSSVSSGTYTITYNANSGTCSKTSDSAAVTKSYAFLGWANVYGSGDHSAGSSYTPEVAQSLYSQWAEGYQATTVTLPTPTRTNYTFRGWKLTTPLISADVISNSSTNQLVSGAVLALGYDYLDNVSSGAYHSEDEFVAYSYDTNNVGNLVPILYATNMDAPYLEPDYVEPYYYVGKSTYNSKQCDVWRLITEDDDGYFTWNGSGKAFVYTNVIVQDETTFSAGATFRPVGSVTLTAQWTPQYIIQFDGNGHTGGTLPSTIKKDGTSTSVTMGDISNSVPTRTGYVFRGWSASSTYSTKRVAYSTSAGGDADYSGTSATIATSSWTYATYCTNTGGNASSTTLTLYAQWEKSQYTVTYNANGGTSSTLPANQTKTHDVTLTLSNTKPTRADSTTTYTVTLKINDGSNATYSTRTATRTTKYTFSKWNTASGGTGTNYSAGGSYTANANVTLYAQWSSSASTTAVTLPTPTRTGYTFKGWSTSDTGSSGTTGSYTPTGNVTLYATWQINTWTVSYNANGGTSSSVPANQTKTYGTALTLSSTKPTRSNSTTTYTVTYNVNGGSSSHSAGTATKTTTYTFSKWNTASNGSGTDYAAGASYTANAAVTLYAQWSGSSSTTSVTLPTPTRTGYTFRGWSTSSTASSGTTGSYTPTSSVTLYATWAKNQITVNLNKDGGAWSSSGKVVSLLQSGSVVETLTASSGSSVVFSSGTYSGSYQVRVTGYSANYTSGTFTATYTSSQTINFYTLTCSAGTGITSASGSGVYYSGESASITASVKTGYTWGKWSDGNTTRSRTITVSGKTTLTASATANTYTIQYLSTYGTGSTASSSHTYDTSKALTSNGFSRTGYTFLGWSTSSTATSATYTNGQSVKNLSSTNGATVKLYAVWKLNATWDPTLKVYNTTTDVSSVAFGTRMVLTLNTSPSGTFPRYRIVTKIGSTVISDTQGTTETYNNITIPESSLSNVSSMSSSYTCYVVVYAIDAAGTSVLNKTFTFTHTLTEASKPTLTVTTELVDLTGICPGKELGRYTKLLIKPSIQFKYGAVLNEYEIFDPTGKSVYLTQVQNPSNYTTAPLDLSAFSGYYSTSDPKLSWVVKVWDSRGQEASTTVTQAVKYNIPSDVHAYVPYIWSGSAWVKYTPEIASSSSINSSDIYVPFIKD